MPFLLVSGKRLDERSSYVRIIFKDTDVCVSNCEANSPHTDLKDGTESSEHHLHHHLQYHLPKSTKRQIVFHLGQGSVTLPLISVTKSLGELELTDALKEVYDPGVFSRKSSYHGDHPENFFHATPLNNADAYSTLIEEVLRGRRQSFVSTKQLLLAWRVWDSVLAFHPSRVPRIYDAGDPASLLSFVVKGDNLQFASEDKDQDVKETEPALHHLHQAQTPATFLGRNCVCHIVFHIVH